MNIFNLFKKKLIYTAKEIHESFNNELDNIILESKKLKELVKVPEIDQNLIDKINTLDKLGFTNTESHNLYKIELKNREEPDKENRRIVEFNKSQIELQEAIVYFTKKYPQYKFITRTSISELCNKFNLYKRDSQEYLSEIPYKNIEEIKNYKIENFDGLCQVTYYENYYYRYSKYIREYMTYDKLSLLDRHPNYPYNITKFEIIAPMKDFDKDVKSKFNDPIVVTPVIYKNNRYYLIVSVWD